MRPEAIDDLDAGRVGGRCGAIELSLQGGVLAHAVHAAGQPEGQAVPCGEFEDRLQEVPSRHEPVDRPHVVVEVRHIHAGIERGLQLGGEFGGDILV